MGEKKKEEKKKAQKKTKGSKATLHKKTNSAKDFYSRTRTSSMKYLDAALV